MNSPAVAGLLGGSLLILAALSAAPASTASAGGSAVARDSSTPSAVLLRNMDVPPEAAHFTFSIGFAGDLTLLGRTATPRKIPTALIPPEGERTPVEALRFEQNLPEMKATAPLLNTFTLIGGKFRFEASNEKKP